MDAGLLTRIPLNQQEKQCLIQCFHKQGTGHYLLIEPESSNSLTKIIWFSQGCIFTHLWSKNRKKQHRLVAIIKDFHSMTSLWYEKIALTYH